MKKIIIMALMAATTLAFAACGDDDEQTPSEAAARTAIIDGVTYQLEQNVQYDPNGMYYVDAHEAVTGDTEPRFSLRADAKFSSLNQTFDLTQAVAGEGFAFGIHRDDYYVQADCHRGEIYGTEGDTEYEASSPFQSGTLKVTRNDAGDLEYFLNGVTKAGHTISVHVYAPYDEIEILNWGDR